MPHFRKLLKNVKNFLFSNLAHKTLFRKLHYSQFPPANDLPQFMKLETMHEQQQQQKKSKHDGNQVYNNIIAKLLHPLRESFSPKAERKNKVSKKSRHLRPPPPGKWDSWSKKRSSKMSIMRWVSCKKILHSRFAGN